jgi:hypothetical protein
MAPVQGGAEPLRPDRGKPNVLLIAADDLNDWVGALNGHPDTSTPHIDRLAARGMLFTNAHAQAPICNPSRTSLMFGMRPSTTGFYYADHGFHLGEKRRWGKWTLWERSTRVPFIISLPGGRDLGQRHWRYIRYADGSEELYDHRVDPNEWTNLAGDSRYASMKRQLRTHLPAVNVPQVEEGRQ